MLPRPSITFNRLSMALLLLLVSAPSSPVSAQLPPEKAEQSFKVSDGLELKLWASEPLCINPTCFDIDHKGRVWYCESVNYRQKLFGQKKLRRPEGDCIVILEDTKGAGKADKRTIFYQAPDFIAPLGIAVAPYPDGKGCKVYVCHSPHIYVFEDKDGDGKADGPPKILLTGFGGYDHDHGVHGIVIGPDNKLYFSVGDTGVKNLQSSDGNGRKWTSNSTDCRAGTIWRCDLDGKNLELIAHNFRNNYKPAIDSFGTIFISDNDDDGLDQTRICYVMPGGNYGYHPRGKDQTHWHEEQPGVVPKVLRTGRGSPTGMCFYEGTLLPKKYWGQPLHTDAGPGRLSCYHLKEKGAGYEVEREDMVTSTDSWFRPSDVCVAPDGSVFVADWYDPGVGGHGIGDFTRGRIYRVAPKGHAPIRGRNASVSNGDIIANLRSPNLAMRSMGVSRLLTLKAKLPKDEIDAELGFIPETENDRSTIEQLVESAFKSTETSYRARSMWHLATLSKHSNLRTIMTNEKKIHSVLRPLLEALDEANSQIQVLALRALRSRTGGVSIDRSAAGIENFLQKSGPKLRTEALLLLRDESSPNPEITRPLIHALAKQYDAKDRFYLAAIGIAVGHPGINSDIDKRRAAILWDFEEHFPDWNDKVAGLVWELRPPGMVAMLEKHLATPLAASQRLQIIDILAGQNDPACGFALVKCLAAEKSKDVRDHILAHLKNQLGGKWKELCKSTELEQIIDKLLQSTSERETAIALAAATENTKWLPKIVATADPKEPLLLRMTAVKALAGYKYEKAAEVLGELAQNDDSPEDLRLEAIGALALQDSPKSRDVLRDIAVSAKRKRQERQVAVGGLAANKDGAEWLLQAFKDKKLNADLTADLARLLRNSPFPDIKKQAQSSLPAPPKFDPKNLPSIPALLARKGNPVRGEQIMALTLKNDAACLKCHTINGTGGSAGPDLSTIGSKASRQNLLESILYPSRAIADQYIQWIVETADGKTINGIVVEDTKDHLILRDVNVKDHKIAAKDVVSRQKSPLSLMPDNLMLFLSEDDLLDIVEYLYGLKNAPIAPTSYYWEKSNAYPLAFRARIAHGERGS
ncbi:MAG: c-type cytochrome [Planctomycetes bacterium]|nr:c-type cytochrome [Planctomycetota bacterium]